MVVNGKAIVARTGGVGPLEWHLEILVMKISERMVQALTLVSEIDEKIYHVGLVRVGSLKGGRETVILSYKGQLHNHHVGLLLRVEL